jgi:hypothetical protein
VIAGGRIASSAAGSGSSLANLLARLFSPSRYGWGFSLFRTRVRLQSPRAWAPVSPTVPTSVTAIPLTPYTLAHPMIPGYGAPRSATATALRTAPTASRDRPRSRPPIRKGSDRTVLAWPSVVGRRPSLRRSAASYPSVRVDELRLRPVGRRARPNLSFLPQRFGSAQVAFSSFRRSIRSAQRSCGGSATSAPK